MSKDTGDLTQTSGFTVRLRCLLRDCMTVRRAQGAALRLAVGCVQGAAGCCCRQAAADRLPQTG